MQLCVCLSNIWQLVNLYTDDNQYLRNGWHCPREPGETENLGQIPSIIIFKWQIEKAIKENIRRGWQGRSSAVWWTDGQEWRGLTNFHCEWNLLSCMEVPGLPGSGSVDMHMYRYIRLYALYVRILVSWTAWLQKYEGMTVFFSFTEFKFSSTQHATLLPSKKKTVLMAGPSTNLSPFCKLGVSQGKGHNLYYWRKDCILISMHSIFLLTRSCQNTVFLRVWERRNLCICFTLNLSVSWATGLALYAE